MVLILPNKVSLKVIPLLTGRGPEFTEFTEMATGVERAFVALEFHSTRSVITVQRNFRTRFHKHPPDPKTISRWYNQLVTTGCLCKGKSPGRPRVSQETVERVRACFQRSPQKSTRRANNS
ncbi:hypothetical protein ANN_26671 [Periplaneta americana]|uniref:DUF4817 domain-containing protein n=1 Tax=Periplaneta americana TaxID=6978 RepID=A0ABQ8RZ05_PERAM|nr:hypothetical protein ANN_26671 [Periplaneta americana]